MHAQGSTKAFVKSIEKNKNTKFKETEMILYIFHRDISTYSKFVKSYKKMVYK